jgi:hypothetical protein
MLYPERIERYWSNINHRKCIKLKKNDRIEERTKKLENKIDKFILWKEKFSNMKLIADILDLPNTRYAIQLKEGGYLIWKFKRKWKAMEEVYTKQNIMTTEIKFTNRKKRRKKLNILANLFDVEEKIIDDNNIQEMTFKENLFPMIKLHLLMHNNNNYFESIHNKKFLFYSQLIERYRSRISYKEPTYLFLTSTTFKEKQRKELFKLHILKIELSSLLVFNKKEKILHHKTKFNLSNSSSKTLNQIKVTNELIDGEISNHSKQRAQPLRSDVRTESMYINIQGEMIPMAYSSSFLDKWNKEKEQFIKQ